MTEWTDPRSIGAKIRMMVPNLTPLEAKVVESVLGRRDFSDKTSLKEVADDAGVSESMVVKIAKKLGEEAVETAIAAASHDRAQVIYESCDLLFHLLVLWQAMNVPVAEIMAELKRRDGMSGIEEKKSRPKE